MSGISKSRSISSRPSPRSQTSTSQGSLKTPTVSSKSSPRSPSKGLLKTPTISSSRSSSRSSTSTSSVSLKTPTVSNSRSSSRSSTSTSFGGSRNKTLVDDDVLELKQFLLMKELILDEERMEVVKEYTLVDDENYEQMMKLSLDERKAAFLEILRENTSSNIMSKFCDAFRQDPNLATVVDEIELERQARKGELAPDFTIDEESGMLIHKQFGSSKRLSETEKKTIKRIMRDRIKVLTGVCELAIKRVEDMTGGQVAAGKNLETKTNNLRNKLEHFVDENQSRVRMMVNNDIMSGGISTSHMLREQSASDTADTTIKLETQLNIALKLTSSALLEKGNLKQERRRCMSVLDISEDSDSMLLPEIEQIIFKARRRVDTAQEEKINLDEKVAALHRELNHLRKEKKEKGGEEEVSMEQRKKEIHQTLDNMVHTGNKLCEMRQELSKAESEREYWKSRIEYLRKSNIIASSFND